jgi:rod shape determining protein RodA
MLHIDRRYFTYFDWISFFLTVLLCTLGLLFVFSATYNPIEPYSLFFKKQLLGCITGFGLYFLFCILDYRSLQRYGYVIYLFVMMLLLFTIIKGSVAKGGQRWVNLFFFKFQPSDVAKLFFPAYFSYALSTDQRAPEHTPRTFLSMFAVLAISSLLIAKQPDLGTGILVFLSGITLMWCAGLDKKYFIIGITFFLITAPISWKLLKPYQKSRVMVFLGEGNVHKERYQIEQSKIAIGSGGQYGKGFLEGTQNKLHFLPEGRTDFIFSVLCEETGFAGAVTLFVLYLLLFLRLLYIITTIQNVYTQLLALGLMFHMVLATIINCAMVTGLLPVVGIPLPLVSYGVSNLWICLASLGWINGIAIRRFYIGD